MRTNCLLAQITPKSGIGRYTYSTYPHLDSTDLYNCHYPSQQVSADIGELRKVGKNLPVLEMTLNNLFEWSASDLPSGYDLYHLNEVKIGAWAKSLDGKIVATVPDLFPLEDKYQGYSYLFRRRFSKGLSSIIAHSDKVIAISHYVKETLLEKTSLTDEDVKVVHCGLDHNTFFPKDLKKCRERLSLPKEKNIILHVGSSKPRKNISGVLKTFKLLTKRIDDAQLIRIGPKTDSINNQISTLGLTGKVLHKENIPTSTLADYYNAADAFLFPSLDEGFGLPPLESIGCGTPVVTSNRASLPEVVGDAFNTFNPDDYSRMADELQRIVTNRAYAKKLSNCGHSQAQNFSWEKTAKKTMEAYEDTT